MGNDKVIQINTGIFPYIMKVALAKPSIENTPDKGSHDVLSKINPPEIMIDLPRGAYVLYLKKIARERNVPELRLLEQYSNGTEFSDADYEELIKLIMTPVNRNWTQTVQGDVLGAYGVNVENDENGNMKFALIEDALPTIKVEAWECIILDILKQATSDIIECFDFPSSFSRKKPNSSNEDTLKYDLGAWKFSSDIAEQSLSNSLRTALLFTLVSYCYGDTKNQYGSFSEFFDAEYFKRVSLIHGIWRNRGANENIKYIPLYDSFHNLDGLVKTELIEILKAVLDDPNFALDEKQTLINRLIDGTGAFHQGISSADAVLEQNLIKPVFNFVLLREKAKETLASAEILFSEEKYHDCANRCYYAMMFTLKALLESKGLLAAWKANELKEAETHKSLENSLSSLVSQGILDPSDQASFEFVRDHRWKCDYSIYKFEKPDADSCVKKAQAFYSKVEMLTT